MKVEQRKRKAQHPVWILAKLEMNAWFVRMGLGKLSLHLVAIA